MKKIIGIFLILLLAASLAFGRDKKKREFTEGLHSPMSTENFFSLSTNFNMALPMARFYNSMHLGLSYILAFHYNFNLKGKGRILGVGFLIGELINDASKDDAAFHYMMNVFPLAASVRYCSGFMRPFFMGAEFALGVALVGVRYHENYWQKDDFYRARFYEFLNLSLGIYLGQRFALSINNGFMFIAFNESPWYTNYTAGLRLDVFF